MRGFTPTFVLQKTSPQFLGQCYGGQLQFNKSKPKSQKNQIKVKIPPNRNKTNTKEQLFKETVHKIVNEIAKSSTTHIAGSAYGNRTRVLALRRLCPSPLDEGALLLNQL